MTDQVNQAPSQGGKNIFAEDDKRGIPANFWSVILVIGLVALVFNYREGLAGFVASCIDIAKNYSSYFITGLKYTLGLSIISVFIGVFLGAALYFLRVSSVNFLSKFAVAFIEIIRGTPLITQLSIVFFGAAVVLDFKTLGVPISTAAFICGIVAVSINSGAYISEIIRSGIQSVPKGQMEAGRSLGMSYSMTMREVIVPQAVKNILPALANEFIAITKETAIVSSIGVMDIMYNVNLVRGSSFKPMEPLIIAALMYFVITFGLSKLVAMMEGRLKAQ